MISKSRQLAAQRAYSATLGRGARTLAVTGSAADAGSADLAGDIAAAAAAFGKRTLLVRAAHAPGAGLGMPLGDDLDSVWQAARPLGDLLWELTVPAGTALHALLNDGQRLPAAMAGWLPRFDTVILDCPPFEADMPALYTPLTASAADAVILVTLPGAAPRAGLEEVLKWLTESGAVVSALVLNDRFNPTLAQEMIREAARFARLAPGLVRYVTRKVNGWTALNMHQ